MAHAPNRPTPAALRALARRDPALGAVMKDMRRSAPFPGFPETATKARESHYESLARAIVFQQLSGKAASTIWGRAVALTPGRAFPKPADLLALGEEPVRGCGISRPKLAALTDLATRAVEGRLGLRNAARLDEDELVARLTAVRGIGVWSAHMFLMFKLGRLDVLPVGDLGVQEGLRLLDGLDERPGPDEVAARGEVWRPLASVASWYLWRLTDTPRCEEKG